MPVFSINENSYPFLVLDQCNRVIPWSDGYLYNLRVKASVLRFTRRGIQAVLASSDGYKTTRGIMNSALWTKTECTPALSALCVEQDAAQMAWFPTDVVDIPNDAAELIQNRYLGSFKNKTCSGSESGRVVKLHDTVYEVSLCDLLDLNLDIVYYRIPLRRQCDLLAAGRYKYAELCID